MLVSVGRLDYVVEFIVSESSAKSKHIGALSNCSWTGISVQWVVEEVR